MTFNLKFKFYKFQENTNVKNTGTKKPKSRQPSKEPEERPDTPGSGKVVDEDEEEGAKTKQ